MSEPPIIDPKPNGPLHVRGAIKLSNSRGEPIATEEQFWLCRCGGSSKKPFCDGTHKKIGFSSAREAGAATGETRSYVGKTLTIHDNRSVCAHAGHCTEQSPSVFSMSAEPWIDADGDAAAKTMATIEKCPSGALAYSVGGVRHEHSGRAPGIRVSRNGPYEIVGGPLLNGDARPLSGEHYTLCRCGQSANKPFCDGAHWDAGFEDGKN